jgi:hypothetical protein
VTIFLWAGLILSVLAGLCALHNVYWSLHEVMCPTHLDHPFLSVFLPLSRIPRVPELHFVRWAKARRQFWRQALTCGLCIVAVDSWRSHLIGVFELNGLWLTIPVTAYLLWNALADARTISATRRLPEELEAVELARVLLDRSKADH